MNDVPLYMRSDDGLEPVGSGGRRPPDIAPRVPQRGGTPEKAGGEETHSAAPRMGATEPKRYFRFQAGHGLACVPYRWNRP